MTQPTPYTPTTDFSADEVANTGGRSTVRTAALDAELANIETTLDQTLANLSLNQRDDGEIRDQRVKLHTLATDVKALLSAGQGLPRGAWGTATAYALRDLVTQGGSTYICCTAHTSGVFATDLAAVKWLLFSIPGSSAASSISFTPTATISATNVQAAIEEVDTEGRAASSSAVAVFAASLLDTASGAIGAALMGFNRALSYTAGTIGEYLARLNVDAAGKLTQPRFLANNTDDTDTPDAAFRVSRSLTTTTVSGHGFRDDTTFGRPGGTASYAAFDGAVTISGANNHDHTISFQSRPVMNGSGTVTHFYNYGSFPIFNSGTVVNNYGAYFGNPTGSGTVQYNYGMYIAQQTKGAINWAIYVAQQGAKIFLGADTRINSVLRIGTAQLILGGATLNDYPFVGYNYEPTTGNYQASDFVATTKYDNLGFRFFTATAGTAGTACTLVERFRVDTNGNIYGGAGAAAMVNGFQYMPSGAGLPGTPATVLSGRVPFYYDTSTNKIGVYTAGVWKWTAALT